MLQGIGIPIASVSFDSQNLLDTYIYIYKKRTDSLLSLSRTVISYTIASLTSHCTSGWLDERLDILVNNFCRSWGSEKACDLIWQCPALAFKRQRSSYISYCMTILKWAFKYKSYKAIGWFILNLGFLGVEVAVVK